MTTIEQQAQHILYMHLRDLVADAHITVNEANEIFLRFYSVKFEDYRTV